MSDITSTQILKVFTACPVSRLNMYYDQLTSAMNEFYINNPLRRAAFMAQIGHESCQLLYMEEIWGPTPQRKAYERPVVGGVLAPFATEHPHPTWQRLGNTEPGDGFKYKGRCPLELTGRSNYKIFGDKLGVDLISHPELACTPELGFRIAGQFWVDHNLNELADQERFHDMTVVINGGLNGIVQRQRFYDAFISILSADPSNLVC